MLAFFVQALFGKRVYFRLMEGEEVDLRTAPWLYEERGLLVRKIAPQFVLTLEEVRLVTDRKGWPIPESYLLWGDILNLNEKNLTLKAPFKWQKYTLYQTRDWGYVLEFLYFSSKSLPKKMYYFAESKGGGRPPFKAKGGFLDTGYFLEILFFPDLRHPESWELNLPGVEMKIRRVDKEVFTGRVLFSQRVKISDEEAFYFAGISRWTGFLLTADQGNMLLYIGLGLTVLGGVFLYGALLWESD